MGKNKKKSVQKKGFKWPLKKVPTIILGVLGVLVLASVAGIFALRAYNWKPTVAFYGISDENQRALVELIQTTGERERNGRKVWAFNVEVLDSSLSLEKALKSEAVFLSEGREPRYTNEKVPFAQKSGKAVSPDLIIMYGGKNAEFAVKKADSDKLGFEFGLLREMTSSVRESALLSADRKVLSVPLLIDNYEFDVNSEIFNKKSGKNISQIEEVYWSDLEKFAEKTKGDVMSPIVLNCKEEYDFLNLFGAFVESLSGIDALKSASSKIWEVSKNKADYNSYYSVIKELAKEGGEFAETISMFKRWSEKSLLPKNFVDFRLKDVKSFMGQEKLNSVSFMTLSNHRTVPQNVIRNFASCRIPSSKVNMDRTLTAPVIFAIPYSSNESIRNTVEMLSDLRQQVLSSRTGLAPVKATNCGTPDVQADDVRYWVAASNPPFAGLAETAFVDSKSRTEFSDALKSFLH